jgi:manganese/zinc/iron transport system permease protein
VNPTLELALVLAVVAVACALPGAFLVLRRSAMTADAVGHVLLFGIALAYLAVRDLDSPWLMVGAAASGVLAVALVEALEKSGRVKADAALGLVFAALFAGGVLVVSVSVRNVHLDVDQVLLGVPELATEPRWELFGTLVAPVWVLGAVLVLNAALVALFYKELKHSTFDAGHAAALGFRPALVHYGLMTVVSVTAVAAFDAVGPVLVVGFFVLPGATAYLLTNRLGVLLVLAALAGALGALGGTFAASKYGTTTAGAVTTALGALFALALALAPERGLIAQAVQRVKRKRRFQELMLAVHLLTHEGTPQEAEEARLGGLHEHLNWPPDRVARVAARAARNGWVAREGDLLKLTAAGRAAARAVFAA